MNRRFKYSVAFAATIAMAVAAGCTSDGEFSARTEAAAGDTAKGADVTICHLPDTNGVNDRSFNQSTHQGIQRAVEELDVTAKLLESTSPSDFEPNMDQFLGQDCSLIVSVGFVLEGATKAAATAQPDQDFAIVDVDLADPETHEDITFDNVRELTFATDEASFLAGYAAAGASKSGIVGTYGGIQMKTVTTFMDGFLAGIQRYNADFDKSVKLLGWDGTNGLFVGDFKSTDKGRDYTKDMIDDGADVILPVAGQVGLGTISEVKSRNNPDLGVIWIDVDGCDSIPDDCEYFVTSVVKKMDVAVFDTISAVADDGFEGGRYVGTLKNNGVDIADFHYWADRIPEAVKARIDDYRSEIIDGNQSVTPN